MRRSHLLPRLVLATILTIGIAPIWITGTTLVLEYLLSQPSSGQLCFRPDGTPLLRYYTPGGNVIEYQDLSGKPVEVPFSEENLQFAYLVTSDKLSRSSENADWGGRIRVFTDTRNQPTFWYLMSDGGPQDTAYFVGYNAANNRRVGYLGLHGFRTESLPVEERFDFSGGLMNMNYRIACRQAWYKSAQFPPTYLASSFKAEKEFESWKVYLAVSNDQLLQVDLKDRTVTPVLKTPNLRSCQLYTKSPDDPSYLVACTDRELLLLDKDYEIERRYAISTVLNAAPNHRNIGDYFHWAEIEPGQAVAYWNESPVLGASERLERIAWFDESGKVSRRETIGHAERMPSNVMLAAVVPVPLLDFLGAAWLYPWELLDDGAVDSWPQAIAMSLNFFWPMLLLVSLFSGLLSAACYFRLVQYVASPTERIVWPVFVWLGGWPAWLAFRFGQRWAVLARCPHCGRTVPRDRVSCAKCQHEFARPALRGLRFWSPDDRRHWLRNSSSRPAARLRLGALLVLPWGWMRQSKARELHIKL